MSNAQVIDQMRKEARKGVDEYAINALYNASTYLLEDCYSQAFGWLGFTGNLPSSYAAGIYVRGELKKIRFIGEVVPDWDRGPVHTKVNFGESLMLDQPYDGSPRRVTGEVKISEPWGIGLSKKFLQSYKPQGDYSLVICTGAEYSEFIENSRIGADVLTGAFNNAKNILQSAFSETTGNIQDIPF